MDRAVGTGRRPLEVSSRDNAHFKQFKTLLTARGIKDEGMCLISGRKIIEEVLIRGLAEPVGEILGPHAEPVTSLDKMWRLSADLIRELDEIGTKGSIILAKAKAFPQWDPSAPARGLEVFLPVGDPNNLGAAVRSCVGLGASRVVLCAEAANPLLPKSIKSSAGAVFNCELLRGPSVKELQGEFFALDAEGEALEKFNWPKDARLLVGEEGQGIPDSVNVRKLRISTHGVESLNATVALSIALFHWKSRH